MQIDSGESNPPISASCLRHDILDTCTSPDTQVMTMTMTKTHKYKDKDTQIQIQRHGKIQRPIQGQRQNAT